MGVVREGRIGPIVFRPGDAARMFNKMSGGDGSAVALGRAERMARSSEALFDWLKTAQRSELESLRLVNPELAERLLRVRDAIDG